MTTRDKTYNANHDPVAVAKYLAALRAVSHPDQIERGRQMRVALVNHQPEMRATFASLGLAL